MLPQQASMLLLLSAAAAVAGVGNAVTATATAALGDQCQNGVCGVQFDRRDIAMNKFVAPCLESQFHVFDARAQQHRLTEPRTSTKSLPLLEPQNPIQYFKFKSNVLREARHNQ